MPFLQTIRNHFIPTHDNAYRPKILHRSWLVFFLALILASEGFLVANLIARQGDQNFLAAVVPAEIVALTNQQRAANNVGQLVTNKLLTQAAQAKADDMAKNNYFSHIGPDGKTPWQWISASGYQYQYAGENLAVRFINSSDVVNAWMASPTHRENIVKPVYTDIGVGVAQGLFQGQMATYVVQFFATPAATNAAAVAAAPGTGQGLSLVQSIGRQAIRAFGEPEAVSNWILGAVAAILIIALVFTFLVHIQIQPAHTLMQAAVVIVFALSFLALNTQLASNTGLTSQDQAASIGYSLFP